MQGSLAFSHSGIKVRNVCQGVMGNKKEMKVNASTGVLFTNTFHFDVQIFNFALVRVCVLINPHSNSQFQQNLLPTDVNAQITKSCFPLVFFLQLFFTFDLIKYDFQKDEPIRNEQGWCSHVRKGKTLTFEDVTSGKVSEFPFKFKFRKERMIISNR